MEPFDPKQIKVEIIKQELKEHLISERKILPTGVIPEVKEMRQSYEVLCTNNSDYDLNWVSINVVRPRVVDAGISTTYMMRKWENKVLGGIPLSKRTSCTLAGYFVGSGKSSYGNPGISYGNPRIQSVFCEINGKTFEQKFIHVEDGPACFPAGSMVKTPQGTQAIETLQKGDVILSWNEAKGGFVERRIQRTLEHGLVPISEIHFVDQRDLLAVTESHTLLTGYGWRKVSCINSNDALVFAQNGTAELVSVDYIDRRVRNEPVFNLITAGEHNFVVENVVAHNFTYLRNVRSAAYNLADAVRSRLIKQGGEQPQALLN